MTSRIRRGQKYQDLDPRRPDRIGTVVHVGPVVVKLRWDSSGYTTSVQRRDLERGEGSSRGYALVQDVPEPPKESRPPRDTAMTELDVHGVRWWICTACRAKGRLRWPWRVMLYNDPLQPRSAVVCSDRCLRVMRRASVELMRTGRRGPPPKAVRRPREP